MLDWSLSSEVGGESGQSSSFLLATAKMLSFLDDFGPRVTSDLLLKDDVGCFAYSWLKPNKSLQPAKSKGDGDEAHYLQTVRLEMTAVA